MANGPDGILSNTTSRESILNDIASKSNGDVAKKYNLTTSRISQIKKANQEIIEQKRQELISTLPSVIDTVKTDINTNQRLSKHIALDFTKISTEHIALKNNLDKTNLNLLKAVDIFPSNTMVRIGDDNSQHLTVISPAFQQFLDFQNDNPKVVDTQGDNIDGES